MSSLNVRLTERDLRIFSLIDRLGAVTAQNIAIVENMTLAAAKKRLSLLTSAGFLASQRYFHELSTLYTLTQKCQLTHGLYTIALSQVRHDIIVNDIYVHCLMLNKYELTSAREFRSRYAPGETRGVRFPDLVLARAGGTGREMIVEYENTDKNLARTRAILDFYYNKSATLIVLCANQHIFNNYNRCSLKLCAEKNITINQQDNITKYANIMIISLLKLSFTEIF